MLVRDCDDAETPRLTFDIFVAVPLSVCLSVDCYSINFTPSSATTGAPEDDQLMTIIIVVVVVVVVVVVIIAVVVAMKNKKKAVSASTVLFIAETPYVVCGGKHELIFVHCLW